MPLFAAPRCVDPHVDGAVVAFTIALAYAATLLAGIAPALHGSRERYDEALNGARLSAGTQRRACVGVRHRGDGARRHRARQRRVFYESVRRTRAVAPGFTTDGVAIGSVSLDAGRL